jgi:integrase
MSLSNVNKIVERLRKRVPELPGNLSPHLLRHTWNDVFSKLMDEKGVRAEQEAKMRTYLMGWRSEESATHYIRRTVRRRSNEVLRELQNKMLISKSKNAK